MWKLGASHGWVDSFISGRFAELTQARSSPQEEPCLQVPRIFLEDTICRVHETLEHCPADLVFNPDDFGISDWEDRKPRRVLVPVILETHNIQHRVSRNVKHISIVICICPGGACFTLHMVTSQDSAALHRALGGSSMQIRKH
jgi:hypothetical protein